MQAIIVIVQRLLYSVLEGIFNIDADGAVESKRAALQELAALAEQFREVCTEVYTATDPAGAEGVVVSVEELARVLSEAGDLDDAFNRLLAAIRG